MTANFNNLSKWKCAVSFFVSVLIKAIRRKAFLTSFTRVGRKEYKITIFLSKLPKAKQFNFMLQELLISWWERFLFLVLASVVCCQINILIRDVHGLYRFHLIFCVKSIWLPVRRFQAPARVKRPLQDAATYALCLSRATLTIIKTLR